MTVREAASMQGVGTERALPDEREVVRRLASGVGWPTVLLTLGLLATEIGMAALWALGVVHLAIGLVVNAMASYAFYTVHHDATHKAISGRKARWRWLDEVCGTIAGLVLLLEFGSYARNHLRHHAHTNTESDPDISVKGPFLQLPLKWALAIVLSSIAALPGGQRVVAWILGKLGLPLPSTRRERDLRDQKRQRQITQAGLLVVAASVPVGVFWPVFFLWWLPSRIGIFLLIVLFQWLPHFPFERTDKMGATRVTGFVGSTWLLLQQDRHLIHHLYPLIPWYRYRAAFRELRPLLEERGAIIQGRDSEPHSPIQLRA